MILVQIAGHLGNDPEERFTQSGQKLVSFRLATNTRRNGKDETVWWRVTVWGDRFAKMMPHLKKGSGVIVVGSMQKPEIYTDKNGQAQISMDLTAEMLYFNPFGKSERQGGASGHEGQFGNSEGSGSWKDSSAAGHAQRFGSAPSRQSPAAATVPFGGLGAEGSLSEDDVPF